MPMPVGQSREKIMTIAEYRKMKLKMLIKDFMIPVTHEQKEHLNTLETEPSIDRYCHTILRDFLN